MRGLGPRLIFNLKLLNLIGREGKYEGKRPICHMHMWRVRVEKAPFYLNLLNFNQTVNISILYARE